MFVLEQEEYRKEGQGYNPGKLIQKFSRNFSFPGRDTDGFLENSSSIFSIFQFPAHELD